MIENINLNGATVSAELHGYMYTGIYGYHGVFDYGSNLSAEIVSNNEIKIKDGLLCNYGRFMRITGSESVSIANGKTGVKRTDLIVAHFESDGIKENMISELFKVQTVEMFQILQNQISMMAVQSVNYHYTK